MDFGPVTVSDERMGGLHTAGLESAEPLGSHQIAGIDRLVALAVALPPALVQEVLRDAGFTGELRAGRRAFQTPVEGVDVDRAKSFSTGQDQR
ncbi:MAG: hypothetical protein M3N28_09870 [Actinomycetota bacterium]|nr:hypothetical protein [Actinomycetota bacterium]